MSVFAPQVDLCRRASEEAADAANDRKVRIVPLASPDFRIVLGASAIERPIDCHPGYAEFAGDPGFGNAV